MARQKTSICLSCNTTFRSRRGAKTCSDRCRKRLQRANASVKKEAVKLEQEVAHVEQAVEQKVVQAEQAV